MQKFQYVTKRAVPWRRNDYCPTSSLVLSAATRRSKKRGLIGRAFCNKKRGEEKMKKGEKIYIIYNARSDIRAAVCLVLDLYGFIIAVNC